MAFTSDQMEVLETLMATTVKRALAAQPTWDLSTGPGDGDEPEALLTNQDEPETSLTDQNEPGTSASHDMREHEVVHRLLCSQTGKGPQPGKGSQAKGAQSGKGGNIRGVLSSEGGPHGQSISAHAKARASTGALSSQQKNNLKKL